MAFFEYDNKKFFYQVDGQGEPLVFLNGIMMSTRSWDSFVPTLSEHNMFIRLDFLDQGQSSEGDKFYTQEYQCEVLRQLVLHLKLKKINIMGVSYGGEVAIIFAIKYPELVNRLMLFNTTAKTSNWLQDIGHGWNEIGATLNGEAYYNITIPVIYSPSFYVQNYDWMMNRKKMLVELFSNQVFQHKMKRLVDSSEQLDEIDNLNKIKAETLIVSSELDMLTPPVEQRLLASKISKSHYLFVPSYGHAFMYENPTLFTALVLGFVNRKDGKISI